LCPLVIFREASNYLSTPIIARPHALQLATHILNILHCPNEGMDASANSSVFRWESKGIKAHGVKHIISLHSLKAGMDIGGGHSIPMPNMEIP